MQEFPHHYRVVADGGKNGNLVLRSDGIPDLESAPPTEFGGPGDQWSPETLLVAAIADCFILSFRAVARVARIEWDRLSCEVDGTLEKVDRVTQFTGFRVEATLWLPAGSDAGKAEKLLHKADKVCLITNSMKAESRLETVVRVAAD